MSNVSARGSGRRGARPGDLGRKEVDDLVKARDLEVAVVAVAFRPQRDAEPLLGAQRFQLCEGEIFGEPALDVPAVDLLLGAPIRELAPVGDVGGVRDVVLVAGDRCAVAR